MADPLSYFPNFLWKTWRTIGLGDPNPIEYDFAYYLSGGYLGEIQEHAAKGDTHARKILMAFRGAAKSYVTTAFGVHKLREDRARMVLVVSATARYASGISNFAHQMIWNFDWLADMKPRNDQRQSALEFEVAGCPPAQKDASFVSESIFGQLTGRRATDALADDIETPNTSDTEGKRQELRDRFAEIPGAILLPGGNLYVLGTAQTEDTIYRHLHEEKGYELRIYPIVYPTPSEDPKKDELRKYGPCLAPFVRNALEENPALAGTSTCPARFNEADVAQRLRAWGTLEFDRQFKMFMDAGAGRGNPLKLRDMMVMDLGTEPPPGRKFTLPSEVRYEPLAAYAFPDLQVDALNGDSTLYGPSFTDIWVTPEKRVCIVDPSGSGEDETSWTIGAENAGLVFALWQDASVDGHTEETLGRIAADCKRWGVQVIIVESNFGQEMFSQLLRPACSEIGYTPEILNENAGQAAKEVRIINAIEPVASTHRLILNAELLRRDFHVDYPHVEQGKRRYYRLTYQLTRLQKAKGVIKHDDRADGLGGLCAHFGDLLQRRLEDARSQGKARSMEEEIERTIAASQKQKGLGGKGPVTRILGRPSPRPQRKGR